MRAILTYHSIDSSGSPVSIDPGVFRRHVEWLLSGRVRVVPLVELLAGDSADDQVALTFDDALESFSIEAWPALREHGLPATLFVPTAFVGRTNTWRQGPVGGIPTLPLLDWESLGRLAEEGVELASHGHRHADLRTLVDGDLERELTESASTLQRHTGVAPEIFAYPYGGVDRRVAAATSRHYRWACTTELRSLPASADPHLLPRVDAFYLRRRGRLEAWGSRRFSLHLALRRIARRVRSRLSAPIPDWLVQRTAG